MRHTRSKRVLFAGVAALGTTMALAGVSSAAPANNTHGAAARQQAYRAHTKATGGAPTNTHTPDDGDLAGQAAQYSNERTAPGTTLSGDALGAAQQAAARLPVSGSAWQEVTNQPYNAQPSNYTDPFWSNVGAGFSLVGGRTTALVADAQGNWYAGAADGGVWKSTDQGVHWTAIFDSQPTLSVGALAIDPADGSLWVGTGEANTSQDSYAGTGTYRSTDGGATFTRVGDLSDGSNPLSSHTTYRLAFDPAGDAYAATDFGLYRFPAGGHQWSAVLQPTSDGSPYSQHVTDVAVVPNTGGQDVITVVGWRGPGDTGNNGFYESTDGGTTFNKVTPTGAIDATDIGRTTFAYSADGSKLYAVVESPKALAAGSESVLQGIFVSSGSPASVAGPWAKIGDEAKLAKSGSALGVGSGYGVGVQAWYNQDLAVDPANANHVYAGLEEVFESTDGGSTWNTASPYWDYGLACNSTSAGCPNTTHPDQHALMITGGKVVEGNDGGVYSRPLSDTQQYGDWSDLNATLHSWQYYDARAGKLGGQATGVVGGLQDNGTAVVSTTGSQMVEPAGGDGFYVVVDPQNANNFVGEYTDGTEYSTTDGGHTFQYYVSPTCVGQATVGLTPRPDCDPSARFVTPLVQDQQNKNVWVTGGEYVWTTSAGWHTSCTDTACSWNQAYDLGASNAVTALSSANGGQIIYAAWVANGGNPSSAFGRGIATNYGGTWHQLDVSSLPNRYIAGVTVDPTNPAHAYAVFNGYSRRFIPGGGVGHVFETYNGGQSWTDISGNLPDIASDALVISHGKLALATDMGMFTAAAGQGTATSWSRLGTGLPNVSVNDVTVGPDGYIYAATHGRGVWRIAF